MEKRALIAMPVFQSGVRCAALVALFLYMLSAAWVSEDAYITFRVIDHFFEGHGLRWNISERVQVYTHPLWMLLHLPLYVLNQNLFVSTLILSLACSFSAVALTLATVRQSLRVILACLLLPLAACKSFMDYTSSGLENPLSYLLFAVFGYLLVRRYDHPRFWFAAMFTVSLALLNRLDLIIFYAPVMVYIAFTRRKNIAWGQLFLGIMPLIAWFGFSLFYYGFLFPNTKYAKLDTGLSLLRYLAQGVHYIKYLAVKDTTGAVLMLTPLILLMIPRVFSFPSHGLIRSLVAGIYIYACYIVLIGGDYMAGRFWSFPIFVGVWLWYVASPRMLRPDIWVAITALIGATYVTPMMFDTIRKNCAKCLRLELAVMDAQVVLYKNQLVADWNPLRLRTEGEFYFANCGKELDKPDAARVKKVYFIGMCGYYAPPTAHLIDELALADPLLARLPAVRYQSFYIAHFRRKLPEGYEQAIKSGSVKSLHPDLAEYYKKLQLIISGDLWDRERLETILLFNLGYYDHWKDSYLRAYPQ